MSLEQEIIKNYSERDGKSHLYNSEYSRLAEEERKISMKEMLSKHFGELKDKTILEIGAGQGSNVPILRFCGFRDHNISLNELLPERIEAIKKNYPAIRRIEGDALKNSLEGPYDCIFQSTVFTSVLDDTDRIALAHRMWQALKPGGVIMWYDFIYNNPRNPNVRKVDLKELKALFPEATHLAVRKITLAPPVGRRVGKWYKWFNLPFLRSHLLALLVK